MTTDHATDKQQHLLLFLQLLLPQLPGLLPLARTVQLIAQTSTS